MPLGDGNLANNADLNITAGSEESTGKQSHNRSRLQMIELLDLNDNNDTEETASEENSDEASSNDYFLIYFCNERCIVRKCKRN